MFMCYRNYSILKEETTFFSSMREPLRSLSLIQDFWFRYWSSSTCFSVLLRTARITRTHVTVALNPQALTYHRKDTHTVLLRAVASSSVRDPSLFVPLHLELARLSKSFHSRANAKSGERGVSREKGKVPSRPGFSLGPKKRGCAREKVSRFVVLIPLTSSLVLHYPATPISPSLPCVSPRLTCPHSRTHEALCVRARLPPLPWSYRARILASCEAECGHKFAARADR